MGLEPHDLSHISALYPNLHDSDDGSFIVEFQHEHTARQYEKRAKQVRKAARSAVSPTKNSLASTLNAFPAPVPSAMPIPFQKCKSAHAAEPITQLTPPPAQTGHTVEIKGLPQMLLSQKMMEAILDQGGLEKSVLGVTITKPDKVQISLSSHDAALQCVTHFDKCKWNTQDGGLPVTAKVVGASSRTQQNVPRQRKSSTKSSVPVPTARSQMSTRSQPEAAMAGYRHWLPAEAPAYVHVPTACAKESAAILNNRRVASSDASTTVSDEDEMTWKNSGEQDWWAGELKWANGSTASATLSF
jgi:hypothetical protein